MLVDIDSDRLKKVVASISETGATVIGVTADVTDEDAVQDFFRQAVDTWGRVDLVVNSAGRDSLSPPVTEVTLEEWNSTIGPNLTAVFLVCREAFRVMEKQASGGRIMNMGSSSTKLASGPGHSPYRASKHGMLGFSKNILLEGKDKNIGVTVINPSHVATPMTEIIDKGLYDGDIPAYVDGWLDEKEIKDGIHASCIDVANVAEARAVRRHPHAGRHHPDDVDVPDAQGPPLRHGSLRTDVMKAAVLQAPQVLSWSDVPDPEPFGERPVLVRVGAVGVCGSDLLRFGKGTAYHYPLVLGHEFSAVVEQAAGRQPFRARRPGRGLPVAAPTRTTR